jgi:protocatechuate 3,4-dioxygenase alpha subunit
VRLVIRVTDGAGEAVADAMVELVQAGVFGRMPTGEDGRCEFTVARPGTVTQAANGQASHLLLCLFARGLLRHINTRIYFAGESGLDSDPVLSLVPASRRQTLLATADPTQPATWTFDLRLQGARETVFLDG